MRWESLREYRTRAGQADRRGDSGWTPPADVSETEDSFIVVAELPGVRREDVDVAATHDTLTIRGYRPDPGLRTGRATCASSAVMASSSRRFTFPGPLAVDAVQADFKDGILTVTLPKAAEARGRRVEVG